MSTTHDRPLTSDLSGRVEALEAALAAAGGRVAPAVSADVRTTVAAVRERLDRGVDHTLVALVGGTGSGKSSLFNALCGLPLADVGVERPTTAEATACVWGPPGDALLDWLGVEPARRFQRESVLDGDAEADLRGLVLLDLPDHDSVAPAHRAVVDRLLPMVDLLVWVVDPQKYADDALHSGYLRTLVGHEAAMVVVLNQVDTVPADVRGRLLADVGRLLAEDGLVGVPVLATAVPDRTGIPDLRAGLAGVVARPGVAAVRAGAEIAAAGRRLTADLVPDVPPDVARASQAAAGPGDGVAESSPHRLPTGPIVEVLTQAAGLPALAGAVRAGTGTAPAPAVVREHAVSFARSRWLREVGQGMSAAWQASLDQRLPPATELAQAVGTAIGSVTLVARRSGTATALAVLAVLAGVAGLVVGGAVLADALLDVDIADAVAGVPVTGWLAAALLLAAGVLWGIARLVRRRAGRRRAATVRRDGRAAVEEVVTHRLVEPTTTLLAEHRHVRELAATAAASDRAVAAATPGTGVARSSTA